MYYDLPQSLIDVVLQRESVILNVVDIAELLAVSTSTIRKEIRLGRLSAYKDGGTWCIERRELLSYFSRISNLNLE